MAPSEALSTVVSPSCSRVIVYPIASRRLDAAFGGRLLLAAALTSRSISDAASVESAPVSKTLAGRRIPAARPPCGARVIFNDLLPADACAVHILNFSALANGRRVLYLRALRAATSLVRIFI